MPHGGEAAARQGGTEFLSLGKARDWGTSFGLVARGCANCRGCAWGKVRFVMQPDWGWDSVLQALALGLALGSCVAPFGCGSSQATSTQPDVQDRLKKLFYLYQYYGEKNRKPPPSEQVLREFGQSLTPQERADKLIPDDVESLFTSPRDGKKFVVQYNVKLDPSKNRVIAWEADGKDGLRYVALSIGYVSLYDEKTLNESKK